MTRILLLFLAILSYFGCLAQPAGANVLYGKIDMPNTSKRMIIKRGDAYRNRGNDIVDDARRKVEEANLPNHNVVIALYPLDFKPILRPTQDAFLIQKEKTFFPNVLPVTLGSTIIIENADDFYHNVFSITPGARFNIGRRPPQNRRYQQINQPGEIKLFCDIHPQMNAIILSLETPYFVRADNQGRYRFKDLPDGAYQWRIFHTELGWKKGQINLRGDQAIQQDFTLSKASSKHSAN